MIATANPIEYEGTYPLPEAQLDRFLLQVSFDYPSAEDEVRVLTQPDRPRPGGGRGRAGDRRRAGCSGRSASSSSVDVDQSVQRYCVDLTRATRSRAQVLLGASPRGSLALVLTARARAVIVGRDYVVPEDVKAVAVAALAHRITLRPEVWMRDVSAADIVNGRYSSHVPAPARRRRAGRPGRTVRRRRGGGPSVALLPRRRTAAALLFLAVALHRPDLVVLAAPLLAWLRGAAVRRARRRACGHGAGRGEHAVRGPGHGRAACAVARRPAPTLLTVVVRRRGEWLAIDRNRAIAAVLPVEPRRSDASSSSGCGARRWARASIGTARVTRLGRRACSGASRRATGRR